MLASKQTYILTMLILQGRELLKYVKGLLG